MATVAQLEAALMKADAAGDEAAAREIAAEIKRARTAKPSTAQRALTNAKTDAQARLAQARRSNDKSAEQTYSREVARLNKMTPEQFYKAPGRVESFVGGLVEGVTEPIELGLNLFGIGGDKAQRERGKFRLRESQQQFPITTTAGEITGNILATAPGVAGAGRLIGAGGKLLTKVLPKAGASVQRVGAATSTGGLGSGRTAAQTAALTRGQRGLQLAERSLGGAIGGVTAAAQTGDNLTEAATFGAGLPVVANVVKRLGGKAVDLTRLSKVKAGQIIREALGEDIEAAQAAFRALSPDDQRLAQQVLVEAGVEPSPFFGLGQIATREMDPDTAARILAQQEAARTGRLAEAAGGETATMQRSAAETGRRGVTEATGPTREAALTRANVAGRVVPEAEALAEAARQQAAEQSGLARRMTFGAERAETRLGQMDDLGDAFDPQAVARERGVAGAMTQRGEQAAQKAIGLRETARDMEDVVADLAAEGMQPLTVAPISQSIRAMAAAPGTRASKLQRRALVTAANQLDALADANGVIDARDLYQFRKSELGDIVNVLLSGRNMPPSGVKEGAAKLMGDIRPMIDDAIEGAGGVGFKDYLTRTRQGFEVINRQELAAKGAQLAKESPDEFTALMRGERPKVVEDIMGKGTKQYDIGGMALADPARYLAMKTSADELETLNKMAQLGARGEPRAGNILRSQQPGLLSRGLGTLVRAKFPAVAFAGTGAQNVESALVNPNVQREIANAFTSGQGALQAMEQYPTAAQFSAYLSTLPSPVRNAFAQAMRAYGTQNSSNQ
jgi:hypothetical protein